ncbi:MAG: hypothetical protein H6R11_1721 [Proteobacteria bacterium]|jgi:hypothetical protein|nr:hypothetical protein [Pseudomonadota bacterium]MBS1173523.1 hypothetical protein [Pseudomonadota bacterium]
MNSCFRVLCLALAAGVWAPPALAAETPEPAGMVKTSQGTVSIDRAGQKTPASPGTSIFVGDRVRTGADGSVGITLRDDTRLTAGPESTLLITEFRFNPNTNEGGLLASLLKGTFSVITGLIAKHSPDNVKFKTPTMTLGIRGTEFLVDVKGEPD